jgi:NADH-quinone oxidoreductase subunit F
MRIKSVKELEEASIKFHEKLDLQEIKVLVCGGTGCVASGSIEIYERLIELVKNKGLLA